ncbi:17984_t:CDS:1, partial [Racocetra fulgida]
GQMLAEVLYKNTTLTSLDVSNNQIGYEGVKLLVEALCKK